MNRCSVYIQSSCIPNKVFCNFWIHNLNVNQHNIMKESNNWILFFLHHNSVVMKFHHMCILTLPRLEAAIVTSMAVELITLSLLHNFSVPKFMRHFLLEVQWNRMTKHHYKILFTLKTCISIFCLLKSNTTMVQGCIQKFPDWPPGVRTANGTALCH
jgi:hypothetical protein